MKLKQPMNLIDFLYNIENPNDDLVVEIFNPYYDPTPRPMVYVGGINFTIARSDKEMFLARMNTEIEHLPKASLYRNVLSYNASKKLMADNHYRYKIHIRLENDNEKQ